MSPSPRSPLRPRAALRALLAATLATTAGCPDLPGHRCATGAECGPSGRCEPIGACSFPAADCGSGRAYGDRAPDELAGTCVLGDGSGCPIGPAGGVADDVAPCFVNVGLVGATGGYDDHHATTLANSGAAATDSGVWNLNIGVAGSYRVEVYATGGESRQATYHLRHGTTLDTAVLDQTQVAGWATLGVYDFAAGGDQWVFLPDNTGESVLDRRTLVYDAIRLTPP